MPSRTIYFDYNATTPLDPAVREAMLPLLGDVYGNPSSVHHVGRRARVLLDEAHERVAHVWQCKPAEVVFTSGGTESVNMAICGAARQLQHHGKRLITSQIEHPAVLRCCEYLANKEGFLLARLPVDHQGLVCPQGLIEALREDTTLVSIMAANNEVGTVQRVAELGRICKEHGVLFHTDAIQWMGKEPFESIQQFNADLVSVCAHKLHGPKGVGALFVRSSTKLEPLLLGGGQENERRAGTEDLAGIIGFTEATERFARNPVFPRDRLTALTARMLSSLHQLRSIGLRVWGANQHRLCNTVGFSVDGCDSRALLAALDLEGICASSGSACSAGALKPSHVLLALGATQAQAHSLIRFSLGRDSTDEEVTFVLRVLPDIIIRAQLHQQPLV